MLHFLWKRVGPHTISVPRVRRADDIDPDEFDNGITDDTFAKIVACLRIAVPYTGMIVSTRESQKSRERVLHLGISQISGGSRTSVGGYAEPEPEEENSAQFDVSDNRSLDEVVNWLMRLGYACDKSGSFFYFHEQFGFACVCVTILIIVALLAKKTLA